MSTFAHRFCARQALSPERFVSAVLRRCLYPHARWVFPVMRWLRPDYFSPDYEFVAEAGRLACIRDFDSAMEDFFHHPQNRGALRRFWRVRVSAQRLRRLVRENLA